MYRSIAVTLLYALVKMSTTDNAMHNKLLVTSVTKHTAFDSALCMELKKIVKALSAPGKGILAADETSSSLDKRFQEIGLENTETVRRDYRQMLFSTDQSQLTQYISGILLNHETVYQKTSDNIEFVEFLRQRNLIAGVKVDKGQVPLFGTENEFTTQGLDDLEDKCIQYKKDGCHFTKWRCTFSITERSPSRLTMIANANVLARYAVICQSARMVPIVEPEVLGTGEYSINESLKVHEEVLSILFRTLKEHGVYLEGMILKPAMVLAGNASGKFCEPQIVAEYTVTALQRTVPPAVSAIMFLSGGQTVEDAILNLNAINVYKERKPWILSFCYGRALQNVSMKIWGEDPEKAKEAQAVFLTNAKQCSRASQGKFTIDEEFDREVSDRVESSEH